MQITKNQKLEGFNVTKLNDGVQSVNTLYIWECIVYFSQNIMKDEIETFLAFGTK